MPAATHRTIIPAIICKYMDLSTTKKGVPFLNGNGVCSNGFQCSNYSNIINAKITQIDLFMGL